MKHKIIGSTLLAAVLLVCTSPSFAADAKPAAAGETKITENAKAGDAKAKKKSEPSVKLVDINSASKKELKTLPGIGDEDADKIIAGRPYGSKAHLTTHNIISRAAYENLKMRVIAKQNPDGKIKPAK